MSEGIAGLTDRISSSPGNPAGSAGRVRLPWHTIYQVTHVMLRLSGTNTDKFLTANPPYLGPHWSSAQEVAIRIVALAFSIQVFTQSDQATPERLESHHQSDCHPC